MVDEEATWFTDDAHPEVAPTLGRASFVNRVWDVIRQSHGAGSSTVFGLVGPWGSGKSSILQWLQQKAESDQRVPEWLTVAFNPWDYPDAAALQAGFFTELLSAFGARTKLDKVRAQFAEFGRTVAPFTSIATIFGLDPSKAVTAAADLVAGDQSTGAARAKLENALRTAGIPVLVIVDDLDRVSAEELLLTLKLVRQLGRLPHVHYLLAYDETTISDVLTRTSLVGKRSPARARDYMEKVVQVRFDIPALRPADAVKLMNRGLDSLSESNLLRLSEEDSTRFSSVYFQFMASRLSTPRSIKRYFAQLRLMSPDLNDEIDYVDFLVLTWLRTLEPGAYALAQTRREELTGRGRSLWGGATSDDQQTRDARADGWRTALLASGTRESDLEGVTAALSHLFPRFSLIWTRGRGSGWETVEPRVANASYFDRYFSFGLTDDDLADAVVKRALSDLGGEGDDPAESRVLATATNNASLVVDKVARELAKVRNPTSRLFGFLAALSARVPPESQILSPRRQLEATIALQMRRTSEQVRGDALRALGESSPELLAVVIDRATRDVGQIEDPPLDLSGADLDLVREFLDAYFADADPLRMSPEARSAVWSWARADAAGFGAWVDRARSKHGDLAALAFFVNVSVSLGTRQPVARLRGFQREEAGAHFDLEELRIRLAAQIAETAPLVANDFDGPIDTPEDRLRVALLGLANLHIDDESEFDES